MVFVIVWFLDHFTLEYVPSMNGIWITTPASLLHVWVTKFKTSLILFKLSKLASNNVMWVGLFAILFDEAQHVVKYPRRGTCLFFMRSSMSCSFSSMDCRCSSLSRKICCWWAWHYSSFVNSRAWIWFVRSSISIACNLSLSCCQNNTLKQCLLKSFAFGCRLENNSSYMPSSLV